MYERVTISSIVSLFDRISVVTIRLVCHTTCLLSLLLPSFSLPFIDITISQPATITYLFPLSLHKLEGVAIV